MQSFCAQCENVALVIQVRSIQYTHPQQDPLKCTFNNSVLNKAECALCTHQFSKWFYMCAAHAEISCHIIDGVDVDYLHFFISLAVIHYHLADTCWRKMCTLENFLMYAPLPLFESKLLLLCVQHYMSCDFIFSVERKTVMSCRSFKKKICCWLETATVLTNYSMLSKAKCKSLNQSENMYIYL